MVADMAGNKDNRNCGEKAAEPACTLCQKRVMARYWCATCGQVVTEKRCPLCGLKARRIREE